MTLPVRIVEYPLLEERCNVSIALVSLGAGGENLRVWVIFVGRRRSHLRYQHCLGACPHGVGVGKGLSVGDEVNSGAFGGLHGFFSGPAAAPGHDDDEAEGLKL